jgi:hypothetical protein
VTREFLGAAARPPILSSLPGYGTHQTQTVTHDFNVPRFLSAELREEESASSPRLT